jgi:hypothetical protein
VKTGSPYKQFPGILIVLIIAAKSSFSVCTGISHSNYTQLALGAIGLTAAAFIGALFLVK